MLRLPRNQESAATKKALQRPRPELMSKTGNGANQVRNHSGWQSRTPKQHSGSRDHGSPAVPANSKFLLIEECKSALASDILIVRLPLLEMPPPNAKQPQQRET